MTLKESVIISILLVYFIVVPVVYFTYWGINSLVFGLIMASGLTLWLLMKSLKNLTLWSNDQQV